VSHRIVGRRGRTERSTQRGAALVEAAIVLPVVLTLLVGIIEFGFIWKDSLAISNAVRAAARIGSADGTNAASDYDILQQIKTGTSGMAVNMIVVFKANSYSSVPASCLTGSVSGLCNRYVASDMNLTSASFNCATNVSAPDYNWCPPTQRVDSRTGNSGTGTDYIGVYVQINHPYYTKLLGSSRTMSDTAILRIEPTN
jgi:Flp pilus assembly protein TadG